jgi:hypothetical protein
MHRSSQRDPAKEQFWRQVFHDWKASGQPRKQFCSERGLSCHAFDYWRQQIVQRDAKATPATPPEPRPQSTAAKPLLMPVRLVTATPLEIRFPDGRSILVPEGFDPKHLRAVLQALEAKAC